MELSKTEENGHLFPSSLSLNLDSCDCDEMAEQAAFWSLEQRQLGKGHFQGKIIAVHTSNVQLGLSERNTACFFTGAVPNGATMFAFPVTSEAPPLFRGQTLKKHEIMALKHEEELELRTFSPTILTTIVISSKFLEEQAMAISGKSFDELRVQERLVIDGTEYKKRTEYLTSLLKKLHSSQKPLQTWEEELLEEKIVKTILGEVKIPAIVTKFPQRQVLAKTAENYIRKNLKTPLTVDELCVIIGTSQRSLHLGFKERFGLSPKAYMQIMRLNGAHQNLLNNNSKRTISAIAMDWGFYHLGRFSYLYKQMFDELPGKTKKSLSKNLSKN